MCVPFVLYVTPTLFQTRFVSLFRYVTPTQFKTYCELFVLYVTPDPVCIIRSACYSNTAPNRVWSICSACYCNIGLPPMCVIYSVCYSNEITKQVYSVCSVSHSNTVPSQVCVVCSLSYSNKKSFLIYIILQHNSKPRVQRSERTSKSNLNVAVFCSVYFKLIHKKVLLVCPFQSTQCQINKCTSNNHLCHFNHTLLDQYVTQQILIESRILARSILLLASFSEIKQTQIKNIYLLYNSSFSQGECWQPKDSIYHKTTYV